MTEADRQPSDAEIAFLTNMFAQSVVLINPEDHDNEFGDVWLIELGNRYKQVKYKVCDGGEGEQKALDTIIDYLEENTPAYLFNVIVYPDGDPEKPEEGLTAGNHSYMLTEEVVEILEMRCIRRKSHY